MEGSLTRAKNANNIMMKDLLDFSVGPVAYRAIGFGLMFGAGSLLVGAEGFFLIEKTKDTFASPSRTQSASALVSAATRR